MLSEYRFGLVAQRSTVLALGAVALAIAACGGDDATTMPTPSGTKTMMSPTMQTAPKAGTSGGPVGVVARPNPPPVTMGAAGAPVATAGGNGGGSAGMTATPPGGGSGGAPAAGAGGAGMAMMGTLGGKLMYTDMFTKGMTIPSKNKCPMPLGGGMGDNISPPLAWTGGPAETKSFAVVLFDVQYMMFHWAIWDIPATTNMLPEGLKAGYELMDPMGAHQFAGMGSNMHAYYGPCSTAGPTAGNYEFRLFALNKEKLDLTESSTAAMIQSAVNGAMLEKVVYQARPE
jgi:hypothetical protein